MVVVVGPPLPSSLSGWWQWGHCGGGGLAIVLVMQVVKATVIIVINVGMIVVVIHGRTCGKNRDS